MKKKDREWLKSQYEYYHGGPGPYQDSLDYERYDAKAEDAEFIASARSLVPELIAEVERLRRVYVPQIQNWNLTVSANYQ
ncbi:MAG: hypothetical protein ABI067_05685 [Leifsonia sp.]